MSETTTQLKITMSTPSGLIDVAVGAIIVTPDAVSAEFDMPSHVHDQGLDAGWFHLGPLASGVGARPFGSGGEVRMQARLDPRFVAGLELVVATPAGVAELLGALDATSPLRSEASWYACSATMALSVDDLDLDLDPDLAAAIADGSVREGYRTLWGNDEVVNGLPIVAYLAEQLERRFQGVDALADETGFRWTVSGADASWTCTAVLDESAGWCVLYSVLDDIDSDLDRSVLVELASDLNTSLLFGSWHVAADSPAVGFRSSLELPDRVAAPWLLDRLITRHLDIVDEYANAFV